MLHSHLGGCSLACIYKNGRLINSCLELGISSLFWHYWKLMLSYLKEKKPTPARQMSDGSNSLQDKKRLSRSLPMLDYPCTPRTRLHGLATSGMSCSFSGGCPAANSCARQLSAPVPASFKLTVTSPIPPNLQWQYSMVHLPSKWNSNDRIWFYTGLDTKKKSTCKTPVVMCHVI